MMTEDRESLACTHMNTASLERAPLFGGRERRQVTELRARTLRSQTLF